MGVLRGFAAVTNLVVDVAVCCYYPLGLVVLVFIVPLRYVLPSAAAVVVGLGYWKELGVGVLRGFAEVTKLFVEVAGYYYYYPFEVGCVRVYCPWVFDRRYSSIVMMHRYSSTVTSTVVILCDSVKATQVLPRPDPRLLKTRCATCRGKRRPHRRPGRSRQGSRERQS